MFLQLIKFQWIPKHSQRKEYSAVAASNAVRFRKLVRAPFGQYFSTIFLGVISPIMSVACSIICRMRRARPRVRKTPTLLSTHAGPIGRRRNPTKGNWKPEPSSHLCFARIRGRSSGHSVMGRCGLLVCDSHCHVHSVTVRNQSTVSRRDRNHSPTACTNQLTKKNDVKVLTVNRNEHAGRDTSTNIKLAPTIVRAALFRSRVLLHDHNSLLTSGVSMRVVATKPLDNSSYWQLKHFRR
jgi:hypothetical protein